MTEPIPEQIEAVAKEIREFLGGSSFRVVPQHCALMAIWHLRKVAQLKAEIEELKWDLDRQKGIR